MSKQIRPILIRRDKDGSLIDQKQIMSPKEILIINRTICVSDTLFSDYEVEGHGHIDEIREALLCLDVISSDPIKLIISCPGGGLLGTFSLYDTIKTLNSPIRTYGHICASGATIILAAGERGFRYVYSNAAVMLHLPQVSTGMMTDTETAKKRMTEFEKRKDNMVDLLIECGAKKSHTDILKDIDHEYWMSAQEAIDYGLADKIVGKGMLWDDV